MKYQTALLLAMGVYQNQMRNLGEKKIITGTPLAPVLYVQTLQGDNNK